MFGKCCSKKSCDNTASARVVDGKLILSLPKALSPVVWQMDLGQAKASALEVRNNEEAGTFTLMLKTPKGETLDIASFNDRALSVEGLMAAARARENAQEAIRPCAPGANNDPALPLNLAAVASSRLAKKCKFMPIFLVLVVLFVLYVIWSSLMPIPGNAPSASSGGSAQTSGDSGVPLSADDYLQRQ